MSDINKGSHKRPREKNRFGVGIIAGALAFALPAIVALAGTPAIATGGGNEDCPEGTSAVAKFNVSESGEYVAEYGGDIVSVDADANGGTFTSDVPISAAVVKGSNNAQTQTIEPASTSGSFSNAGLTTPSGNTPAISNVKFCAPNEVEEEEPEGSNNSSSSDCETITVGQPTGVKPEGATVVVKLDGKETKPGTYPATPGEHVVDTYVNDKLVDSDKVTVEECEEEEPEGSNNSSSSDCETITVGQPTGVKPEGATVVVKLDGKETKPGTYPATPGEHVVDTYVNDKLVDSDKVTVEECEVESCPPLTGSVKTTTADGTVVNGNIYDSKTDVYVSGTQLGDEETVYIRVTDPSGSTVLSDVKQVSVTDGSFGPVQLPAFADTPNNGDEYKVWVSSTPDFEQQCTKFDNFKVKGEEPPPPCVTDSPTYVWGPSMVSIEGAEPGTWLSLWDAQTLANQTLIDKVKVGEDCKATLTVPPAECEPHTYQGDHTSTEPPLVIVDTSGDGIADVPGFIAGELFTVPADDSQCEEPEDPTFNPDGMLDVNCDGNGSYELDNSASTDGDVDNGGTVGFEVVINGESEVIAVPAGETVSGEFTGANPGSQVILRALDSVVDTVTVPEKCDEPDAPKAIGGLVADCSGMVKGGVRSDQDITVLLTNEGVQSWQIKVTAGVPERLSYKGNPGDTFTLSYGKKVLDKVTVPAKCTPPPPKCPQGTTVGDTNGNGMIDANECDKPDSPVTTISNPPAPVPTVVDAGVGQTMSTSSERSQWPFGLALLVGTASILAARLIQQRTQG